MTPIRVVLPPKVKERISAKVAELADEHGYLRQKRPANGLFIERLVAHADVGLKLTEFVEASRIKSYVKDVFIKEYSEARRKVNIDPEEIVPRRIKGALFVEHRGGVWKFSANGGWIVAACCSLKRWEIGLKKAALVASGFGNPKPKIALLIHTEGSHANSGDKKQVEQALMTIGVDALWC